MLLKCMCIICDVNLVVILFVLCMVLVIYQVRNEIYLMFQFVCQVDVNFFNFGFGDLVVFQFCCLEINNG